MGKGIRESHERLINTFKPYRLTRKTIIFLQVLLFVFISARTYAYDALVDGIYYDLNQSDKTATVTFSVQNHRDYSGHVTIPNTIRVNGNTYSVTSIGNMAFYECSGLTSITIPNSVTCIGNSAFDGCSGLTSITIPNSVTFIDDFAFYGCSGLTSITIPNSVTSIRKKLFGYCRGLTSITIPNSVTSIGEGAFEGCSGLTSITIPNSVTSIGNLAFSKCRGLTSITISNGVTSIGNGLFDSCSGLTSITIPNSVTSIDAWAFCGCRNLSKVISNIKKPFSIDASTFAYISGSAVLYVPKGTKSSYQAFSGWTSHFTDIIEESGTQYSLSITASGSGSVSYSSTSIRNKTTSFSIDEGSSATITFTPDTGYRIASVKVGSTDVTSSVRNNQYTISSVSANTTVTVTFEAIPPTTYTLSITASGNGSASYSGTTVRGKTTSFTVNEGSSATITFTPDTGYRIASVKVGSTDVTSKLSSSKYTISNISANTTVTVTFEAIPPTTYTLSITASGNGSASYSGTTVRGKTTSFTVNEGTSATITFTPDTGYRIASVKVGSTDVTSQLSSNKYTISNISANTTVTVTFEAIPPTTYTLSITASGSGTASYSGTSIRGRTTSFTVEEGTSVTIAFTPDNGYRIGSVKVNNTDVTSNLSNNRCTINSISRNTTVSVVFEEIPVTTYSLSITASGNGSATYNGTTVRGKTTSFTVNEGTSATITFTPDTGYRIASVKVGSTDVTSSLKNNQYTLSNISSSTTLSVTFEAITYTLSITASGNGTATYGGTSIKSRTTSFTVEHGTSATITFTPDDGYQIASVKVGNTEVTSSVRNNQYTISSITANTTVTVTFEVIPPKIFTLSITASGNGSASYGGTTVRSKTSTFDITEGTAVTVTFTPDNGYRVASVWVNNTHVTADVKNNQYSISNVSGDITMNVAFEEIPATTYTLSVTAMGSGSIAYGDDEIRNGSNTFTVNEGAYATFILTADIGFRIGTLKVNNADYLSHVKDNQFTVNNITRNTTVSVVFEEREKTISSGDMNYTVTSYETRTLSLARGVYGQVLTVPATVDYENETFTVTGMDADALTDAKGLAAIIWNPDAAFTGQVSNPNLLLYVNDAGYAPSSIKNVVVNGTATSITLTDAAEGNDFYCPEEFTAQRISYAHRYDMITGLQESGGWETIALPFDVDRIEHGSKGMIIPFLNWQNGNSQKPFWLYEYGSGGFREASSIRANTPYIISMPNNEQYLSDYRLNGTVTFSASNTTVRKSDDVQSATNGAITFVPNFMRRESSDGCYALNVKNDYVTNSTAAADGSMFVRNSRAVLPFEAYMTTQTANAREFIPVFEDVPTGIKDVPLLDDRVQGSDAWYTLDGRKLNGKPVKSGVYIFNGKKAVVR